MQGIVDAGVTWQSEAVFQQQMVILLSISRFLPLTTAPRSMLGAKVKHAPHPRAAAAWLTFIRSPKSIATLRR